MEEEALLGLLKRATVPGQKFVVGLRRPVPASRDPADKRPYVTFSLPIKLNGELVHTIEDRYSRSRRFHWRLVELGLLECFNDDLSFPPMYWWRNMRDDTQNIYMRARQLQTYFTRVLGNPTVLLPVLERAFAAAAAKKLPPPRVSAGDAAASEEDSGILSGIMSVFGSGGEPVPKGKRRPPPRKSRSNPGGSQVDLGQVAAPVVRSDSDEEGSGSGGEENVERPRRKAKRLFVGSDEDSGGDDEDAEEAGYGADDLVQLPEDADENFFGDPDASVQEEDDNPWWEETFYGKEVPEIGELGGMASEYTTGGDVNSYSGGGENTRFVSYNKFHEPTSDLFAPLSTQGASEDADSIDPFSALNLRDLPAPVE